MRYLGWIWIALAWALPVHAQTTPGAYVSHRATPHGATITAEHATARVTFYRPAVVRIDWLPRGATAPDSSFTVVATPEPVAVRSHATATALYLRSPRATVTVTKDPVRIHVARDGAPVLQAAPDSSVVFADTTVSVRFALDPTTHVYGSGERGHQFDLRGTAFRLYNTQQYGYQTAPKVMKVNVPFFPTSGGYAAFIDNTYPGYLDVGVADTTAWRYAAYEPEGTLTYYVIAARAIPEQLRHYTWLTGRQPMPPKWGLGYIQSRYGYQNAAHARGVVDTLRTKGFPVDGLVLDLYWFEHMGDLAWNRERFPQPFDMMRDLKARGVQTIAITEPFVVEQARLFDPLTDRGWAGAGPSGEPLIMEDWWSCATDVCRTALVDLTDPAAQQWWWSQYPEFMGDAMAGLWTDLGEPERHPRAMTHHLGSAEKVHNIYNFLWAQTLYENFRSWRPNQRMFNLTRSGFAGIQRYGTFLWSGDVGRSFSAFQPQTAFMLNMGLSGLSYYSSDLGGFTGGTTTPELYARWLQYGAFTPTMRAHGVEPQPTEPWGYGPQVEAIVRDYVRLRYRLMPYLYSTAWQNHTTGLPIVRPLFFLDPSDPHLQGYDEAFLFGDAFLVAPVQHEGQRAKTVYLPKGTWVHYWTEAVVAGGDSVTVDAPLARLPLFVRAGRIVPTRPVRLHTGAQPADSLGLQVYPHATSPAAFTLYEDDGRSQAYASGAYALTRIEQSMAGDALRLTVHPAQGTYDGLPAERTLTAAIHRMATAPTAVHVNGTAVPLRSSRAAMAQRGGAFYDADRRILHVRWTGRTDSAQRLVARGVSLISVTP